uniref:S-protein homolog n=1 Tax=Panagrellus redivivus TaxID=6233 RepID=A0A7E4VKV2_PANRE
MVNSSERNLKLHCQSNLTDLRDQFIYEGEKFEFSFYDFDPENKHFWCDAYGLNNFFESFDIFGKTAPSDDVMIWYLQPDGLYYNDTNESGYRQSWWTWSDTAL